MTGRTSRIPIIVSSAVSAFVSTFPKTTAVACVPCTAPVAPEDDPVTVAPAVNVEEVLASRNPSPFLCSLNFRTVVLVTSCIFAVALEVPPVIVSSAENVPVAALANVRVLGATCSFA